MKIEVLDVQGNKVSDLELNDQVWAIEPHKQAIFDTVIAQQAAMRQATNKVKTRAEVRGGGRKPWKQKGTGRARQGSIRAPQWRGGGVAFGPTGNNNYKLSVNKKVKALAFRSALSLKAQEQNLVVIDKFSFEKPSTKKMIETLTNLKVNDQKTLIVTKDNEELVVKSGANLASVKTLKQNQMNVYDLLNANKLVVTQDAISVIEEVWG